MSFPWLLLQLADGAFPNGGFAHSSGLEATMVLGGLLPGDDPLAYFLDASLRQLGRAALPFVRACARDPKRLSALDAHFDAMLPMLATNRSSRTQGRALASAAFRVWSDLEPIAVYARQSPAHHAPVFGAVFGSLGVSVEETSAAYLHGATRSILSAGVRLGLVGPMEAQRLHADRAVLLESVLGAARDLEPEEAASTAPLLDMFAALHDRLDGRMFQS
jgi:urease accessory protein